jgi:hypothetical protein
MSDIPAPVAQAFQPVGVSDSGVALAVTKPHRLKPAPLSHDRENFACVHRLTFSH